MKDEKFKVIDFIRKLIIRIDTELANFPKKEIEIKNRIRTNTYDILELAYLANETRETEEKNKFLSLIFLFFIMFCGLVNQAAD